MFCCGDFPRPFVVKSSMSSLEKENSSKEIPEKKKMGTRMKIVLFLLIGGIFLLSSYFLWRFLGREAIGTINEKTYFVQETFDHQKERKFYDGKYIDFSYPAIYSEKRHEISVNGPMKESIFLSADERNGKKIAVTVEKREKEEFETSPSVQMRLNEPKKYNKKDFSTKNLKGIVFGKENQVFEQTAFFFSDGFLISISVTSAVMGDGLEEQLGDILKSVKTNK